MCMKLDKEEKQSKKLFKGIGMMGMCCLLPVIIFAILPFISSRLGVVGTRITSGVASLICPIMMIVMMVFMIKGHGCCSKKDENESE